MTQTISAIITLNATLSNAEQLIYFSVFETVLSNSIKGATKRPNIKLKASIAGSESLVVGCSGGQRRTVPLPSFDRVFVREDVSDNNVS